MQRCFLLILTAFSLFAGSVAASDRVLVYAASSMTTALNLIAQEYERETQKKITISYASSSALARQLAYGAPADIYISANEKWMDYAISEAVIDPVSVSPWVENALVLIANPDDAETISLTPDALLKAIGSSRIAISDPSHVPAGIYAKEALQSLGIWHSLKNKMAFSNSVRATLALVEHGEAPLGIVYRSDAIASPSVSVVADIPNNTHTPIVFPKALTTDATLAAQPFFDYLDSNQARIVLRDNGFIVINKPLEHQ
ncbi:molybdate ABC transporter substrate-binding protein [Enterovibrio norvegicus FF-33]|uniref:molybdate ABC transporter substrate-binding protein n=1 Tax=Enterovibrio norvegicus TaxID=188144 RepID=UPI0002E8A9F4|nr:molybdate ABC transporter substrate-binding protein [Enterovibrio norvegicus]OEE66848.1 molybdate ABC transporter substrate-binding protein [Enterovibrio norvegicus FF-33]